MAWDYQALVRSRTIVHGHLHLHQLTAWKALTTRHPSAARSLRARSRLSGLNDPPITLYSIFLSFRPDRARVIQPVLASSGTNRAASMVPTPVTRSYPGPARNPLIVTVLPPCVKLTVLLPLVTSTRPGACSCSRR